MLSILEEGLKERNESLQLEETILQEREREISTEEGLIEGEEEILGTEESTGTEESGLRFKARIDRCYGNYCDVLIMSATTLDEAKEENSWVLHSYQNVLDNSNINWKLTL